MQAAQHFNIFTVNPFTAIANLLPTKKVGNATNKTTQFFSKTAKFIWLLLKLIYSVVTSEPAKQFYNFVGLATYHAIRTAIAILTITLATIARCYEQAYQSPDNTPKKSKIIGYLPPAKIEKVETTFKDFCLQNLPEFTLTTEIVEEPESLPEPEITVDINPEISQRITYHSSAFTTFYTLWDLYNTASELFKEVKVSELKSYAKDLNIPQYRKLKKLELLIAITQ